MLYRILTIVSGIILLISTLIILMNWGQLPEQIPTHFTITGEADAYGGKGSLVFLIVLAWVLFIMLSLSVKFPNMWNFPVQVTEENKDRLFAIARFMIEILKFLTCILLSLIMLTSALSFALPSVAMVILFVAIMATVAVCIFLMFKNR